MKRVDIYDLWSFVDVGRHEVAHALSDGTAEWDMYGLVTEFEP